MSIHYHPSKTEIYQDLVLKRKKCKLCEKLTNPSVFSKYDSNEIGPWSIWQGDLDADILVIGQDWGDTRTFILNKGLEKDSNPTNKNLVMLFKSIDISIEGPESRIKNEKLFFTNTILCLKEGGLNTPVKQKDAKICCEHFLKPLITLIHPKVVIALGRRAYNAIASCYNLDILSFSHAVEIEEGIPIEKDIRLFPVYHCGTKGWYINRKGDVQIKDWKKLKKYLDSIKRDNL